MTKAYKSENHEGIYTIVFADDANKARSAVQSHENGRSCDMEYTDIRVQRAAEYDKYDGLLPSLKILVKDHDWFVECSECSKHIDSDEKGRIWIDESTAVCSSCKTPMQVLKALSEIGEKANPSILDYDGHQHIWHDRHEDGGIWMTADIAPCDCDIEPEDSALGEYFTQAANARPALKWAQERIVQLENRNGMVESLLDHLQSHIISSGSNGTIAKAALMGDVSRVIQELLGGSEREPLPKMENPKNV